MYHFQSSVRTFCIVLICGWGGSSAKEGKAPRCGQLKYPNATEVACEMPDYFRPPGWNCKNSSSMRLRVKKHEILRDDEKRIIVMELGQNPQWKTGKELKEILAQGLTYIDLTMIGGFSVNKSGQLSDKFQRNPVSSNKTLPIPTEIRFQDEMQSITQSLDIMKIKEIVTKLASYKNRIGDDTEDYVGVKAANWVRDLAQKLIEKYAGPCAGVYEWQHINIQYPGEVWDGVDMMPMKSVIVRLQGSNMRLSDEVVVLGAHLDTISKDEDTAKDHRAPGADDNGSGCAALLETLRVLMEAKFQPRRTIEFHFYSYEEYGLIGSGKIAKYYSKHKVNVVGVLNLDVVGHCPPDNPEANKMAISFRDTHETLNNFVMMLMDKYVAIPWEISEVCQGCNSDHAAWTHFNLPASFPHEKILSPFLHSRNDSLDTVNFDYFFEFTKLALAYAVEYGEPVPKTRWKQKH